MDTAKIEGRVKELNSFQSFNPMQKKALKKDIYTKNIVLSAPTASGKTIIAELAALNCIINRKKKVIYTCPLKAIASEHYREFKRRYAKEFDIRIAISTGDFDSSSRYLSKYDLILCTNEKLDSLIRHQAPWLQNTGLVISDEIHELDSGRGATLEMVLAKLRSILPKLQILALSATIPNAKEIADWLNASLVESDYRPVELKEGILLEKTLYFPPEQGLELSPSGEGLEAVIEDTLAKKKQALFFMNTRRNAEGFAKKAAKTVWNKLLPKEKDYLQRVSERIENVLESPTEQCKSLAALVRKGAAFHHAGLMMGQRELVEDAFKAGKLKLISATPTLAAGVNLPSFRVVIPSLYRYTEYGMQRIPVREYKQMSGRAGRPKYDSKGESIIVARSETEFDELKECYVEGELEAIESKLSIEPVLRMHLLALIATRFVFDHASMEKFFSRTFYAKQYGNLAGIMEKLDSIAAELEEFGFVEEKNGKLTATALGHRVSDLYLDPVSAKKLVDALQKKLSVFSALFAFSNTREFMPWISAGKKRESELWQALMESEKELPIDISSEQFFDPAMLDKFNSALLLGEWIGEKREQELMEEFNTRPGILFSKLRVCDWLAYSAIELSRLLGREENIPVLLEARKRLKYGVRKDLLPLVELRGIGRVRGRRLYRAGLRSVADLKKVSFTDLVKVLGETVAASVKSQLGQKVKRPGKSSSQKRKPENPKEKASGQRLISAYK